MPSFGNLLYRDINNETNINHLAIIFAILFLYLSYYNYEQSKIKYSEFKATSIQSPKILMWERYVYVLFDFIKCFCLREYVQRESLYCHVKIILFGLK